MMVFVLIVLRSDKYTILLVMYPQHSHVTYLDSCHEIPKDYTDIKGVLDDAITGFADKEAPLKLEKKASLQHIQPQNGVPLRQAADRQRDGGLVRHPSHAGVRTGST